MSSHIVDGEFQSDKYPTTPRGKVPLSVKDPTAQDLLWAYAQRRRAVDAEFSEDLEAALRTAGYVPIISTDRVRIAVKEYAVKIIGGYLGAGLGGATTEVCADAIATHAAEQLVGVGRITREERDALQWAIAVCTDHGGPGSDWHMAVIDQMFSGGPSEHLAWVRRWAEIMAKYRAGKPTLGEVGRCRGGGVSEHAVTGAPTTGARQRRLR